MRPRDWTDSTLGERMAYALEASGLPSQRAVAKEARLVSADVNRMFRSRQKRSGSRKLDRVAGVLRCEEEWLRSGAGEPPGAPAATEVDTVAARPPLLAMARCLRTDATGPVLDAALAALTARAFPPDAPRETIELAFAEELARAEDMRRRLEALCSGTAQEVEEGACLPRSRGR